MKQYAVRMGDTVMFGPTTDIAAAKDFKAKLAPEVQKSCSIYAQEVPSGEAKVAAPPAAKPGKAAPAPAAKPGRAAPASAVQEHDAASVFGSYLSGSGSSEFWKPQDGRNIIRILPKGGVLPSDWKTPFPLLMSGVHSNVGLSLNETVYCPRLTHGRACPICNFVWKLYKSNNEQDKKLAGQLRGYKRTIANIIDLSDVDAGVQPFAFGIKLARKIMGFFQDPEYVEMYGTRDPVQGLLDPVHGRNFVCKKSKVDGFNNYDESRFELKESSLAAVYPGWEKGVINLVKYVIEVSYEDLEKILNDTKRAMLDSDAMQPRSVRSGPSASSAAAVDDASNDDAGVAMTDEEINDRLKEI